MNDFNIYLAGGMGKFGKEHFDEGNDWRIDLRYALSNLGCNRNVRVINPNDYYNFLNDNTYDSDLEVMDFDLNKVRNSNLIICNFNDIGSLGTMAEIAIAYEKRIPVIGLCEDCEIDNLHPWQKSICSKIFVDKEDLISYVSSYYLD